MGKGKTWRKLFRKECPPEAQVGTPAADRHTMEQFIEPLEKIYQK